MFRKSILLFILIAGCILASFAQDNVGIGTPTPDASAKLEVFSSDKGLLLPRMNSTTMNGIGSPAQGLMIFNTTDDKFYFNQGGSTNATKSWVPVGLWSKPSATSGDIQYTGGTASILGSTTLGKLMIGPNSNTQKNSEIFLSENISGTVGMRWLYHGSDNNLNLYGELNGTSYGPHWTIDRNSGNTVIDAQLDVNGVLTVNNSRVEFTSTNDASGTAGSGVLEIGNSLRLDNNEIITNTNTTLFLNSDNNGDVRMDGSTFSMDASTGRVGIGTTAPDYKLDVAGDIGINEYLRHNGSANDNIRFSGGVQVNSNTDITLKTSNPGTGSTRRIFFDVGAGQQIRINKVSNGGLEEPGLLPTATNWGYIGAPSLRWYRGYINDVIEQSDNRVKENIRQIQDPLAKILQLNGVVYDRKLMPEDEGRFNVKPDDYLNQIGVLAQDTEKILPSLIDYDSETDSYGVRYSRFGPLLIEGIKAQQEIIDAQQSEIDALKARLQAIEEKLNR